MKRIVDFLRRLDENNNRQWFMDHKSEYMECKAEFDDFARRFIDGIRSFDPAIGPLDVKDCTYRIYRDTRFSQDKTPYKVHMGVFVVPGGKKSGYSGYYFQVGPHECGYTGGCMLASGNYCCDSKVLHTIREDMHLDDGEAFARALKEAKGWKLDFDGALKKVPRGFPADKPYSDWLRLKNYCLFKEPGVGNVLEPDLLDRVLDEFRRTRPFLELVNRAITYVAEDDI